MTPFFKAIFFLSVAFYGIAYSQKQSSVPEGFPNPKIPPANVPSDSQIALGRALFYEGQLALDGKTSCGSCHQQHLAFSDGKAKAIGATSDQHPRNSMSLTNVAYNSSLTWADPNMRKLETQALVPLFNEHPIEMGLQQILPQALAYLNQNADYRKLFKQAYPNDSEITLDHITQALASFQRTFISFSSTFDQIMMNDLQHPDRASILNGMSLFFSEELSCSKCHGGYNLSGPVTDQNQSAAPSFHHNGLLGTSASQNEQLLDAGLAAHTGQPQDWGKFRAPTLRNIAVTAPYMHNGSLPDLASVVEHYSQGGQSLPKDGIAGKEHPNKSPFIKTFRLSPNQQKDLIKFLESLTDRHFLNNPALSNPHISNQLPKTLN